MEAVKARSVKEAARRAPRSRSADGGASRTQALAGGARVAPARRLRALARLLEAAYGRPSLDDHDALPPLDELIFTILSQNTSDRNRDRAWEAMRKRYRSWDAVLAAPRRQLESVIRAGGLAPTKSARIQEVLRRVKKEQGAFDLDFLREVPVGEAEAYLRTFKGVGMKTIRCVLLFSCRRPVIPVDTHILRVGKRLGLLPRRATPDRAHEILQAITPPEEIYPFHVNLIAHGRRLCRARRPRCGECLLASRCDHIGARAKGLLAARGVRPSAGGRPAAGKETRRRPAP